MGLTAALSNASRTLEVFSGAIQVAGNNIANADTPGYIREKLEIASSYPSRQGALIFGNGVVANGIRQQIDKYLEKRVYLARSDTAGAQARSSIYKELENYVSALSDGDLGSQLNEFVAKLNDVATQPESQSLRQLAIQTGQTFADNVQSLRDRINEFRTSSGDKVKDLVQEANGLIDEIAKLNPQIIGLEAGGLLHSDAAGLRNQRYQALNRLSEIIPVRAIEQPEGGVDLFVGSDSLILSGHVSHLTTSVAVDRGAAVLNVQLEGSNNNYTGTQGELAGRLYGRDEILGKHLDTIDQLAKTTIFEFNKIFSNGQGLNGYSSVTSTNIVQDPTAALNSTAAGLPFQPSHGSFQVQIVNKNTGAVSTSTINVNLNGVGTQTSLNSLASDLNGVNNLTASITTDGRLQLDAANGFEIRFANDNSGTLASLGVNTFFTGSSAADIGVNSVIAADARLLAAGKGGGPGDGSNAVDLAAFIDKPVAALGDLSISDFYTQTNSTLGQSSASETALADGSQAFLDSLLNQRAQTSGVSLDEETIGLLKYQRGYQATARLVTVIDQLYETLLNI